MIEGQPELFEDSELPPLIITVYAYCSKEALHDAGGKAGLEGEALNYFMYAEEYELKLNVDRKTGRVTKVALG